MHLKANLSSPVVRIELSIEALNVVIGISIIVLLTFCQRYNSKKFETDGEDPRDLMPIYGNTGGWQLRGYDQS